MLVPGVLAWTACDPTFREKVLEMEQAHSRGNFHSGFDMSLLLQLLTNQCFRVNGKQPKPPQFYSHSLELVTIVIVINAVIGRFSGEDLR